MMNQISSLAGVRAPAPAVSVIGEWRRYADFLRRPALPERASGPNARSVLATGRLLLLDYALMAVLMTVGVIAYAAGVEFPQNELENLEWGVGTLLLVVIGAPIFEEVLFRGWLSGRLGHALATLLAVPALAIMTSVLAISALGQPGDNNASMLGMSAVLLLIAAALIYAFRHRDAARWFTRVFPLFFWLSALGFATIHIWNYAGEKSPLVFLLVIPQLVAGTIFAYARVNYGLWSAILLHMLHNGTAVALALSMGEVMG